MELESKKFVRDGIFTFVGSGVVAAAVNILANINTNSVNLLTEAAIVTTLTAVAPIATSEYRIRHESTES